MNDNLDLFARYPDTPGHRGGTSEEGANAIAPQAATIRDRVLAAIDMAGDAGLTVVEFCDRYGFDRFAAQPRFSELRKMHKIADAGLRRRNPSGVNAVAWVLPQYVPAPAEREAA